MFPTIAHLIHYITGIEIALPVQTFGFFVAVSFWVSYLAFKKEFKRKEKLGLIRPFTKKIVTGTAPAPFFLIAYTLTGFVTGYKAVFIIQHYNQFIYDAADLVFSLKGNILGGAITGLVIFLWLYFQKKREQLGQPAVSTVAVHPYQVTDKLLLWCASFGFIGAIVFAKLEYIGELFTDPLHYLSSFNGLVFYGALIFGAGIYLYKTKKMGIPFLTAADIGSPGMMLAYGCGRIGCHLSGDGDWGIVNTLPKPGWLSWAPGWVWSFDFPHNVMHQGKYIEGCTDSYCSVLPQPVFPTSLYESVICLVLFMILWLSRNKIKQTGTMFFIFLLCNGAERFFMEFIKVNPKYCMLNLCLTQAQFIAILFCLFGIGGLLWLFKFGKKKELTH